MSTPDAHEIEALRERKSALEAEIAKLRDQTSGLDELRAREAQLAKELTSVDGWLAAGSGTKHRLPLLDRVRVASPCKADWNEMLGDERVRFCLGCEKSVYNLSSMLKEEAEALLQARLGNDLCVRFFQRADGTILTQDCPVGVTKKRRKKLALAVAGAGAMAAAAATMFMRTPCRHSESVATAGSAVYDPTPPIPEVPVEGKGEVAPIPVMPMMGAIVAQPDPTQVHPEPKRHPLPTGKRTPARR